MKEQTIAKMVKAGVGQDRAEKFYALFLSAMCGGIEPEAGDTFTREDIAAAFPGNGPAWTGVAPFPFSNPEAVRWLAAATEAYSPERAKNICQVAGISTGNVYFQQGARGLWTSIAESAANQGKLRALFDYTVRDDSAAAIFREWRS